MQQRMSKCIECGSKDLRTVKKDLTFNRKNPGVIKINKNASSARTAARYTLMRSSLTNWLRRLTRR